MKRVNFLSFDILDIPPNNFEEARRTSLDLLHDHSVLKPEGVNEGDDLGNIDTKFIGFLAISLSALGLPVSNLKIHLPNEQVEHEMFHFLAEDCAILTGYHSEVFVQLMAE